MTTDNERREVARRLRELEQGVIGALIPTGEFADGILRAIDYGRSGAMTPYGCLADLIEPSGPKVRCVAEVKVDGGRLEKLVHDVAVELTGIDRDALLELADEMEDDAGWCDSISEKHTVWAGTIRGYSDRIRKALGVES